MEIACSRPNICPDYKGGPHVPDCAVARADRLIADAVQKMLGLPVYRTTVKELCDLCSPHPFTARVINGRGKMLVCDLCLERFKNGILNTAKKASE